MEKKGICGICSAGCWIIADYDDNGRITGIRPDKESEMGIICKLGEHAPEIIYSKDRLLYPMKRKGKKGEHHEVKRKSVRVYFWGNLGTIGFTYDACLLMDNKKLWKKLSICSRFYISRVFPN